MGIFDDDPQKVATMYAGLGLMAPSDMRIGTIGQIARAGLLGMSAYQNARQQQRQDQKDEVATLATTYKILQDQDNQERMNALFTGQPYVPDALLDQHRARLAKLLNLSGPSGGPSNAAPPPASLLTTPPPASLLTSPQQPQSILGAPAPTPPAPIMMGGDTGGSAPNMQRLPYTPAPQTPTQLPPNGQAPQPQPLAQSNTDRLPTVPELLRGAGIDPRIAAVAARTPEGQRQLLRSLSDAYGPKVVNNVLLQYQPNGQTKFLGGIVNQDSAPVVQDGNGGLKLNPIPNSTEYFANRAGAITDAQEQAKARNDLVPIPQGNGTVRYVTRAQAVNMTGQNGGNQTPGPVTPQPSNSTQATPGNPYGYGVATQVTPDVQHARDVQRLQILLDERSSQLKQYGEVDPMLEKEIAAAQGSASDSRNAKLPPWKQADSPQYQGAQTGTNATGNPGIGFPAGQSTAARTAAEVNPKLQLETLQQSFNDNTKLNDSLVFIDSARKAVNGQTTTGLFAKPALLAARVGTAFGITDPKAASDPEVFMAMAGREVMGVIKNLGSGSGISDADREYAAKAVGGQITLNKDSINRLLDIQQRAIQRQVEMHNSRVDQAAQSGVPSVFSYKIQPYGGSAGTSVTAPNGRVYNFPTADAAQRFKQQAGLQ